MTKDDLDRVDDVGAIVIGREATGAYHAGSFIVADGFVRVSMWINDKLYGKTAQVGGAPHQTLARMIARELVQKHDKAA